MKVNKQDNVPPNKLWLPVFRFYAFLWYFWCEDFVILFVQNSGGYGNIWCHFCWKKIRFKSCVDVRDAVQVALIRTSRFITLYYTCWPSCIQGHLNAQTQRQSVFSSSVAAFPIFDHVDDVW